VAAEHAAQSREARITMARKKFNALPGFGLTLGLTLFLLSGIVLIPFGALVIRSLELSWSDFWRLATTERALASYELTFGASFVAALANALFGTLLAWVLVRYEFPGRRWVDAMVDFPFALPTAVAGLTLANLFASGGWLGRYLVPLGIQGAYTRLGVIIALTFVGLPFVVRTLQPVLQNLERELEEAAATLGAGRWRTFASVIAPSLFPAILTGFALAFARAIGEYGSVVFISGNAPFKTEIAPYLIVMRLDEYDYAGAIALAVVLLFFSFVLLAVINLVEQWAGRFQH
jgi:sulfate transport system permease protein